ncbi:MAG: GGDEF domain-containing protein, partial [Nitriliruptoraceae bacterium]
MSRPNAEKRVHDVLATATRSLHQTSMRVLLFGVGVPVVIAAHLFVDGQFSWLSAPLVFLAGLSAGTRFGLGVLVVVAVGHIVVDAATLGTAGIPGGIVRSIVLAGIMLLGATGAQLERQREAAMLRAVREDPVTGLLSVRAFYDELETLRADGQHFAIVLADLRGMRALNERYGHPTGTEAMRTLAHVLRRSAGPDVPASRLGSDELAVALVGADRERCRNVVKRIVERLPEETVALPDGERFEVHAAYGIAR